MLMFVQNIMRLVGQDTILNYDNIADMKFVKLFTLADFWPKNVYPKVRKSTFSTFHDKSA